jgi:hypothetical protein
MINLKVINASQAETAYQQCFFLNMFASTPILRFSLKVKIYNVEANM